MDTSGRIYGPEERKPIDAVEVEGYPNPHCNQCYGRGYIKMVIQNAGLVMPCYCCDTTNQETARKAYNKRFSTEAEELENAMIRLRVENEQ
jgi:ribosomal protein L37AE/L43A